MGPYFLGPDLFQANFGFIIYSVPENFLTFSCLSFLTPNEDKNTSLLRERTKSQGKLLKHGVGPTNCYLKLFLPGGVGSGFAYFSVLNVVHLLIIW